MTAKPTSVRLPYDLHERLKDISIARHTITRRPVSVSTILIEAAREYVTKEERRQLAHMQPPDE